MRREDVLDLIKRLPPTDHTKTVFVLHSGISINMDMLFRSEPEYLVIRGREAGTNDDGRAFFLPYAEVAYVKIERVVKVTDLKTMYGVPITAADDDTLPVATGEAAATPSESASPSTAPAAPAPAMDPAAIARQNLLERIRAARTSVGRK
jgi:hypothetical protein